MKDPPATRFIWGTVRGCKAHAPSKASSYALFSEDLNVVDGSKAGAIENDCNRLRREDSAALALAFFAVNSGTARLRGRLTRHDLHL